MSNIIENNFVSYLFNFLSQYFWTYSDIIFENGKFWNTLVVDSKLQV